jgi:hypothetical protein
MVVVLPTVFFESKPKQTTAVAFLGKSNFTEFPPLMKACEISFAFTLFAGSGEPPALPPLLPLLLPLPEPLLPLLLSSLESLLPLLLSPLESPFSSTVIVAVFESYRQHC